MRVIAFRGERNVAAIVEKAYADLSPETKKLARAALLKANPQLKSLNKVKPGSPLVIPEVPGLKPARGLDDPRDEITGDLVQSLKTFGETMEARHKEFQAELEEQERLLRDGQLKLVEKSSSSVKKLVKETSETIQARAEEAEDLQERLETALKELKSDLSER